MMKKGLPFLITNVIQTELGRLCGPDLVGSSVKHFFLLRFHV